MEISGKRILVTGGAGFIGSHLSDHLLRLGAEVISFDDFSDFYTGKEENVSPNISNHKYHLVKGSILDFDSVLRAMRGCRAVFHLAAQAGVRYSLENPRRAHDVNVTGTINVLEAARRLKIEKLVNASSSSVYGNPSKVPIGETHPLNPTNPYGASKLAAEKYCQSYYISYGFPVVSLRYFSVYGPRGRPDQVLYSMAVKAASGLPPEIYGDGSQSRDFTYVTDIVSGTIMAALRDDSVGEVYNLGCGAEFSMTDAADRIINRFNLRTRPIFKESYKGDFSRTLCDNKKARGGLGWNPQVNFSTGLDLFLDWFETARAPRIRQVQN